MQVDPHRVRPPVSSAPPRSRRCRGTPCTPAFRERPRRPARSGQEADLVVVAPATAGLLAHGRAGRADDLLTATLLTAPLSGCFSPRRCHRDVAASATADNVGLPCAAGAVVLEPAAGRLTGARHRGPAGFPEPEEITTFAEPLLARPTRCPTTWRQQVRSPPAAPGRRLTPSVHRQTAVPVSGATHWRASRPAWRRGHAHRREHRRTRRPAGVHVVNVTSAAQMHEAVSARPRRPRLW